jgi:hypothetical protein
MQPDWRQLDNKMDHVKDKVDALEERGQIIDQQMAEYLTIHTGEDKAANILTTSSLTHLFPMIASMDDKMRRRMMVISHGSRSTAAITFSDGCQSSVPLDAIGWTNDNGLYFTLRAGVYCHSS